MIQVVPYGLNKLEGQVLETLFKSALEPHIAMSLAKDIAKSTKRTPPKPAPIYVFCGTFDGANESCILIFVYNIDPL